MLVPIWNLTLSDIVFEEIMAAEPKTFESC